MLYQIQFKVQEIHLNCCKEWPSSSLNKSDIAQFTSGPLPLNSPERWEATRQEATLNMAAGEVPVDYRISTPDAAANQKNFPVFYMDNTTTLHGTFFIYCLSIGALLCAATADCIMPIGQTRACSYTTKVPNLTCHRQDGSLFGILRYNMEYGQKIEATKNGDDLVLKKNKGQFQMSLNRKFVDWLLNNLDTSVMLDQLNSFHYSYDEYFIQTLASNEFLNAPGGFTHECFDKQLAPGLTRMTIWKYWVAKHLCHSGLYRHDICIYGLKDLVPNLNRSHPFLFANKMVLQKDAEAVQCWHEAMFNRTYLFPTLERLDKKFYTELPQVRYNALQKRTTNDTFNSGNFNCRYKFINSVKMYQELGGEYKDVARLFKRSQNFASVNSDVAEQYQHWQQNEANASTKEYL
uniref:Uncharacterized protein n=1 Tax=Globodera rostochiensis TaxID=31243 RepID=A0A914I2Z3_GLORO